MLVCCQEEHFLFLRIFDSPYFWLNFTWRMLIDEFLSDIFVDSLVFELTANMLLLVHDCGDGKFVEVWLGWDELLVD